MDKHKDTHHSKLSPPESLEDSSGSSGKKASEIEGKLRKKYTKKMKSKFEGLKQKILVAGPDENFESLEEKLQKAHTKLVKSLLAEHEDSFDDVIEQRRKLRSILDFLLEDYKDKLKIQILAKTRPAIGIDLGTTYSCVSVCYNGNIVIMPNEVGRNTTPSYLAIDGEHTFIGQPAKDQAYLRPLNTIFDAKRLIGRNFDDVVVQKDIEHWPFEVINVDSHPKILVDGRAYHPEEISAEILKQLKRQAEDFLGRPIYDAVITVPAYFNNGQRQATKKAGELAGFNVLRILNEPTAAAITYNLHRVDRSKRNVLIYDLGGGTFDVSVLTIENGDIKIKAVGGDTHLGGEDFDNAMVGYCIDQFREVHGLDLADGKYSEETQVKFQANKRIRRLRNECEKQKISLTATKTATVVLDAIMDQIDLNITITREVFEGLIKNDLDKCMQVVENVISDAVLEPADIDDIVLVGGSSHIPDVKQRLKDFFPGKYLCQNVNPDEAVAKGAAIQACLINEGENNQLNYTGQVSDVTPLPLGVAKQKIYFAEIVPKNTQIPCERIRTYTTRHDNQKTMRFPIFEGEDELAENNHKLGEIEIINIPEAPKGEQKCDVLMKIDADGIFTVQASLMGDKENQKTISISLNQNRPTFSVDELLEENGPPEALF